MSDDRRTRRLLLTGAVERPGGFELGDGRHYGSARVVELDLESGQSSVALRLDEGNEHYPAEHPNLQFTAGTFDGEDKLWLPTDTELRLYAYPSFELLRTISHPYFQNIHSVHVINGDLVVTSTGLDMVAILDWYTGDTKSLHNVEGKDPWYRWDPEVDYRLVHSTRPHQGHPNYVFDWRGELWVTRCTQEDAVCLLDPGKAIPISGPDKTISVHDGHVVNGRLYFTSVDGHLIVADPASRCVVEDIDISSLGKGRKVRGWCRGISIEPPYVHVAFSKLRQTRVASRIAWAKNLGRSTRISERASLVTIDIERQTVCAEYELPPGMIDAIYGVLPIPTSTR